jgi:hypothetical protein
MAGVGTFGEEEAEVVEAAEHEEEEAEREAEAGAEEDMAVGKSRIGE